MISLNERQERNLFAKIEVTGFCWNWLGPLNERGYGQFRVGQRMIRAHRVLWEWLVADIPEGLVLDHLCENQRCVNPDHLEPKTQRANVLRGRSQVAINAQKTHCLRGHELAGENLILKFSNRDALWRRICRACKNAEQRERRARPENREHLCDQLVLDASFPARDAA